jgi:hypothetical protein
MARRSTIVIAVMAFFAFLAVPLAQADTGDIIEPQHDPQTAADGWQAGTCKSDTVPGKCSPETPEQYYTQAGGHPPVGITQYIIQHGVVAPGAVEPIKEPLAGRSIKTLRVDLPPGLTVNPRATPAQCTLAEFLNQPAPGEFVPLCKPETITGEEQANVVTNVAGVEFPPGSGVPLPKGARIPLIPGLFKIPVYNLVPKEGEPALFGFVTAKKLPVFLETDVSWESDFHEAFTIRLPAPTPGFSTLISRQVNFGDAGNGTFISNPTTCFDPLTNPTLYSTWFRAESHETPNPTFPNGSTPFESPLPPGVSLTGCEAVPFDPSIKVDPGTTAVDSPAGATVTTEMPFENPDAGGNELSQSHLRSAKVTLPLGMGLNPSGAKDLVACSDAQFKKNQRVYENECPANSKIGTVEIETPPLPVGALKGDVYVGEQKSMDPTSGEEFRVLVEAKNKRYGIAARLIGNVSANPATGQLTTTFDDQEVGPLAGPLPKGLPQVPFESVKIQFDGAKAVLTSPSTCAKQTTTSEMEPWARPGTHVSPTAEFTLSSVPGGGSCPQTLGERKFVPGYTAKSDSTKAGAYSPFRVHIGRSDGEQELKVVNVTLPKGLTGKLAGIPYCSEAAIAAAAASTGKAEQANSSCSSQSQIGTVSTESGTGANPLKLGGKAFLAGPYKAAPLSMVTITPAVAGPFDLGTVVVRVALGVNPETAQITAASDTIPDVFGGVKLDLRAIDVNVDRAKFMLNPTNCAAQATSGTISGGGSDPTNSAAFSSYAVSAAYQATECNKLGFKPKLHTRLYGPVKRAKNPRIRAILEAREGDANISRTALTLPHSLFLDQSHIRTVCTRVQLADRACPKGSVYGQAEAKTPLLDKKLKGPVYLVSSDDKLPNLVADLRGQVNIRLRGVISSKRGGLKTVFPTVPDVPVKKFILNMKGGKKSLLVNSRNLCKSKQASYLNIKAQNGKKVKKKKLPLKVTACGGKKKK